jgi:N-ethylmaleimide reductase
MANNGYTLALANQSIAEGKVDLVAFGRPFIANPDLVERFRVNAPLSSFDPAALYGGGAKGYTDYSTMEDVSRAVAQPNNASKIDSGEQILVCKR